MARVVLINLPAHGHTNPTLPLVAELTRRGDHVVYYSFDEFRPAIERSGAIFRSYQDLLDLDHQRPDPNLFRGAAVLLQATLSLLPELLPRVQADAPDYLIYDSLCAWGKYTARLLNLPAICSTTTFAINARVGMSSPSQLINFLRMILHARPDFRRFQRLAEQLSQTYHLPKPQMVDMFRNEAELNLVYTSEYFQPFASSFPKSYRFVGPTLSPQQSDDSFPLPSDKRILYISLGTLFNENLRFYRHCFQAFAGMDLHVVLSVGKKVPIDRLGAIPPNFTVQNFVPQLAVLQRSDLFITHGGMNSVHEALLFGVPLIVVPQAADQEFVARRVPAVGAGIHLHKDRISPDSLRDALKTILSSTSYREASRRVGQSLRMAGGAPRAADEIAVFKQQHGLS
jgi:MGT family glycosyltransferase